MTQLEIVDCSTSDEQHQEVQRLRRVYKGDVIFTDAYGTSGKVKNDGDRGLLAGSTLTKYFQIQSAENLESAIVNYGDSLSPRLSSNNEEGGGDTHLFE